MQSNLTRRDFLSAAGGLAITGVAAPYVMAAGKAKEKKERKPARQPAHPPAVKGDWKIAAIGVGGRGSGIGHSAAGFGSWLPAAT